MGKAKYTPGPWKHDDTWGLIVSDDGAEIAACHAGRTGDKSETLANAALIAAAPEMLEALHEAERLLSEVSTRTGMSFFSVGSLIRAAIEKAEGKS